MYAGNFCKHNRHIFNWRFIRIQYHVDNLPMSPVCQDKQGVLNPQEKATASIYLCHVLFEKINHNQNDDTAKNKFKIVDWPINSLQAREALADITFTHRVTQLGNLSSQEIKTLMGAVVRAS
ncbi:hypothetical protein C8J57DRAFT_1224242 [Mycena rebaudengoi]|nr:hypothetical protein C8J57DRAFT_1224242 [Mycena rebaudengoi]